jgi:hypothetical protein
MKSYSDMEGAQNFVDDHTRPEISLDALEVDFLLRLIDDARDILGFDEDQHLLAVGTKRKLKNMVSCSHCEGELRNG